MKIRTLEFKHCERNTNTLWDGLLGGTVRTRALVLGQSPEMQARVRAAFDRLASEYAANGGLELPVSVKLASGRKP